MPSAIKSFDQAMNRIKKASDAILNNENSHREYAETKRKEAIQREKDAERDLEIMKLEEATLEVIGRIEALFSAGQLAGSYIQFFKQIIYTLPDEFRWNSTGIKIVFNALGKANAEVAELFKADYEKHLAEAVSAEEKRAHEAAERELDDLRYFDACVDEIVRLFKTKDPTVKRYFDLVAHLKTGITTPRHHGLDGFTIIVKAIRHQMPGFAAQWHEKLEVGLRRAAEREAEFRANRRANHRNIKKENVDVGDTALQAQH